MATHDIVKRALKAWDKKLREKNNVVGTGLGERVSDGKKTGETCVVVLVEKKVPLTELSRHDIVPANIVVGPHMVRTDVIEVGKIVAHGGVIQGSAVPESVYTERHRPCPAGVSVGHYAITAGTFGCVVKDKGTDEKLILSNNHVLANSNDANVGDEILQPGPYDGGSPGIDKIGTLLRYVPIDFGSGVEPDCSVTNFVVAFLNFVAKYLGRNSKFFARDFKFAEGNIVDAAVAKPTQILLDQVLENGVPRGTAKGSVGMKIRKTGRTTGYNEDEILATNVSVNIDYGENGVATFTNQFLAGAMSEGGDSGSAILDMNDRFVGLLFAGSSTSTIICPGQQVLDFLDVTI